MMRLLIKCFKAPFNIFLKLRYFHCSILLAGKFFAFCRYEKDDEKESSSMEKRKLDIAHVVPLLECYGHSRGNKAIKDAGVSSVYRERGKVKREHT